MIEYKIEHADLEGQFAHVRRYDDPSEAATHLRATVKQPTGRYPWGHASEWYGGESPEQAVQLAHDGNDAHVAAAEAIVAQIESAELLTVQDQWLPSQCGAYPIVPEALAGRPDCMRRRFTVESEHHPVRVYVNTTSSGGIDAQDLQRRGAAVLAFVMVLAQGRPVELWQVSSCDAYKHWTNAAILAVRLPTAPLNVSVCSHMLTSQAWTRGVCYGWMAESHESPLGWEFGKPSNKPEEKARHERMSRCALGCDAQDVYIPPIVLGDELTKDPVGWINRELVRIRGQVE